MPTNAASALDNIILLPGGRGFRGRYETVYNNSTEFGSADNYPVLGVGSLALSTGGSYFLAIKKGKAYSASASSTRAASYTDRTGSVTISTGGSSSADRALYRWSFCTFNDLLIGFGGAIGGADAPFKWIGAANNIAALGGSPPSANICFSANNRVFAARTTANPSTIYWTIIGNAEDWSGVGSGSAVAGSLADGEPILDVVVLSNDLALIFKQSSIYAMDLTSAPFPIRLLFSGVGCGGPNGFVVVKGGVAYFMTSSYQMKATDGNSLIDFPSPCSMAGITVNTPASAVNLPIIYGFRLKSNPFYHPAPYDLLVWVYTVSSGGTDLDAERVAIAWDFDNKCWLRFSTGFAFISGAYAKEGTFFGGWTNQGRLFTPDWPAFGGTTLYKDDLTTNSGNIASFWQSGWLNQGDIDQIVKPDRFILHGKTLLGSTYSSTLTYGYDFGSLSRSATLAVTSGTSGFLPRTMLTGRGNLFKYKIAFSPTTAVDLITFYGFTLGGKVAGQKEKAAS